MSRKKLDNSSKESQTEQKKKATKTENSVAAESEVKRGRGRPKKTEAPAPEKVEKAPAKPKARSKPTEEPSITPAETVKSKRGRPAKVATTQSVPVEADVAETKKPRGRKPKVADVAAAPVENPKAEAPKKGRGRPKKQQPAEETVAVTVEAEVERSGRSRRRRRRRGGASDPSNESSRPAPRKLEYDASLLEDVDLPVPVWRSRGAESSQDSRGESTELAARKSKRRRRKDLQDADISAAAALEPRAQEKEKPREKPSRKPVAVRQPVSSKPLPPPPIIRPAIQIPDDAPQVAMRNGLPTLVRNGRVYPPIMFFGGASDEKRAATVFEEVQMAGKAGIHLHAFLVEFEVDLDSVESVAQIAAYLLSQAVKADPEAQVLFRLVFVAPPRWSDKYSDAVFAHADGSLAEPSVCDDTFWNVARECLGLFVKKIRLHADAANVLGVHLERGEWFFAENSGYDNSPAAVAKFRDWARARYLNDIVALRAAWFDGQVKFETLVPPPFRESGEVAEKFIRNERKERRWVDYHLFLSDTSCHRIQDLANAAKIASEGYFLVGVSYGYTFEWSHPASGHLSLGKILRSPEIDFIAGPPSYGNREPGGTAPFPSPIDSFVLNGKLYISEEDFKTSIGGPTEPDDDFNPVIKTPQALESVHWRGIGSALAHGSGACWMDLWGNGWLKTANIWERGKQAFDVLTRRMAAPVADPDVAVFIDERALAYLVDQHSFALLVQNVRESVLRSGLSAGFFLLSDLQHREKFPASKLNIFLNAWDTRPELRAAIKSRLQCDKNVLFWLYAAGLFDSGRESLERAREVTGIALRPQPFLSKSGTTILNRRHVLGEAFADRGQIGGSPIDPTYFAIPENATVVGEYTQTGLPSYVVQEFDGDSDRSKHWTSVFLGDPTVTPALIRALGQMAGAHVWNYMDDLVHVRAPFLTVHCKGTGMRTITLPTKWSAYNWLSDEWVAEESTHLRFSGQDGATYVFLVGAREEIEAVLNSDPNELLKMEALPPKPDNTLASDSSLFDVPIMKLDEWMEGGAMEGADDEWLLGPKLVQTEELLPVEETEESRPGRRRRRRRGGDRERGTEREFTASDPDLGLTFSFRKRE